MNGDKEESDADKVKKMEQDIKRLEIKFRNLRGIYLNIQIWDSAVNTKLLFFIPEDVKVIALALKDTQDQVIPASTVKKMQQIMWVT